MAASHDLVSDRRVDPRPDPALQRRAVHREDLVIHGQVEGTIGPAPKVTIGPEAHVKAGVNADVIIVEGRVEGDLKAGVSITVRTKANVRGNLEAPVINIAEGATFNGGIKMEPRAAEANAIPGRARESSPVRTGTAN
jgi:cytoskeletal protein CcmA (bactofilin family)